MDLDEKLDKIQVFNLLPLKSISSFETWIGNYGTAEQARNFYYLKSPNVIPFVVVSQLMQKDAMVLFFQCRRQASTCATKKLIVKISVEVHCK